MTGAFMRNYWTRSVKNIRLRALPALKGPSGEKVASAYHWGFVVSRGSKKKALAWEFVRWLNSPKNKMSLAEAVQYPPTTYLEAETFRNDPFVTTFVKEFMYGRTFPKVRNWNRLQDSIMARIDQHVQGKRSAADALRMAEQEANAILARNQKK